MYACQLNVSGCESTVVWPSQPDPTFTCPPVERTLQVDVDARGFGTALRGGCASMLCSGESGPLCTPERVQGMPVLFSKGCVGLLYL